MAKDRCRRKVKHATYLDAMRAMTRTRALNCAKRKQDQEAVVYECPVCGTYHWGHKKPGELPEPQQIKDAIDHCENVDQVDWIMRFYAQAVVAMKKGKDQHLRTMAIQIENLAHYRKKIELS